MIEMLLIIGHAFYDAGFAYEFAVSPCENLKKVSTTLPQHRKMW